MDEWIYVLAYLDGLNSMGVLSIDTIIFPSADVPVTLLSSVFGMWACSEWLILEGGGSLGWRLAHRPWCHSVAQRSTTSSSSAWFP